MKKVYTLGYIQARDLLLFTATKNTKIIKKTNSFSFENNNFLG